MSSISYVISVFNKAQCLSQLIHGLKNQLGDFKREFIFIDDGSTDESLDILRFLAPQINGKIITQYNQGPSVAINSGLKIASCDWVFLVDGDDYLYPDASQTLLNLAINYPAAVVCKARHSNDPINNKFDETKITYIKDSLKRALKFYPIGASSAIIKRKTAQEVGGCDIRVFIQDYSIALRLALKGSFVETNKLIATNIDNNQQRLSTNKIRENYCTALARFLFIKDNADIAYQYKYYALQHQLRKSWLWHLKNQFLPKIKHFKRYLLTRLKSQNLLEQQMIIWFKESLEVFNE